MFSSIVSLIRTLQSNTSPVEIASGAALAVFFGFIPLNHPLTIVLVLMFFLFKINRGMTTLLFPFFKLLYIFGGAVLADKLGYFLLVDYKPLRSVWEWATQAPVLAYFDLNQTLVTGGLALSALAAPFVFGAAYQCVQAYRASLQSRLDKLGAAQWLKRLAITQWLMSRWPK